MTVEHILPWGKRNVRAVLQEGRSWFAVPDIFAALDKNVQDWLLARFEPGHLSKYQFADMEEPVATLTMVGAQTVAMMQPVTFGGKILYKWLAKHDSIMRTPESGSAPHIPLTMLADGSLPPRPDIGPHWKEWLGLREAVYDQNSLAAQVGRARERLGAASCSGFQTNPDGRRLRLGLKPQPAHSAATEK